MCVKIRSPPDHLYTNMFSLNVVISKHIIYQNEKDHSTVNYLSVETNTLIGSVDEFRASDV